MPVLAKVARQETNNCPFSILTKNALQNVMAYFRPWGRDFSVLRRVNKRTNAAYHDRLKQQVNIQTYMTNITERVLEDTDATLTDLFAYAVSGKYDNEI